MPVASLGSGVEYLSSRAATISCDRLRRVQSKVSGVSARVQTTVKFDKHLEGSAGLYYEAH